MNFFKKMVDHEYKELEKFKKIADKSVALYDDILVEAYAVVKEVDWRVLGEKPYYCQLLGAIAIHYGNIAELKTGEGKTLVTTLPAYLNALGGKGVHVITVNEYLTGRNAEWMGGIYSFLGVTVGVNDRELSVAEKQAAYNCDILYTTNNEIGFDYLRDNMVVKASERVQRGLNFAIIDEIDSALIDEARTPLIISGGFMQSANLYMQTDHFAKTLKENAGYIYDEQTKAVSLDETGVAKAEKAFGIDNLFDMKNVTLVHFINQALKANFAMKKDFDYVVENGEVIIVDPFTGRLMHGRQYSDGLHQAIEAKENVKINEETKTLATVTFQNLFRMYKKLSGMTGTAKTEEEEFRDIYNMYVICIPTNKPVIRIDCGDLLYTTKKCKYKAIVEEIKQRHEKGQPVLVGTVAVETSELISGMLNKMHIPHEVLNAKNNAREAEIIAKAGEKGSVTIATNMAGRGTDIKIDAEVKSLGGLCVIGTERHESRRIDNQLRGRSGRQGDPGFSQFCVSFEDDLMVRFGTDRAKAVLAKIGFDGDMSIRNKMLSNSIEAAQKRVEGNNFDMRKTLLQYDDVINQQRKIIYDRRNEILDNESIHTTVLKTFKDYAEDLVYNHADDNDKITGQELNEIIEAVNQLVKQPLTLDNFADMKLPHVVDVITERITSEYETKIEPLPKELVDDFEKAISLRVIDIHWMENINSMDLLREGIHLRSYAQEDPLRAYQKEGFEAFDSMLDTIDQEITAFLLKTEVRQNMERKAVAKGQAIEGTNKQDSKHKPKHVEKIGRNDPCPCGSGKKYKQCCGK